MEILNSKLFNIRLFIPALIGFYMSRVCRNFRNNSEKLAGQGFFSRNRFFAGGILLTSKPVKT